ncbi:MAG TPA: phosphotransferase [Thermomicrobiales bacterium]|jgi:hygromycin-B 4-O-kinase|nr:phosphotransferase [Thermomicrobiales bacterium]
MTLASTVAGGDDATTLASRIATEVLGRAVTAVRPLAGGMVARGFRVHAGADAVVVRVQPGLPGAFDADWGVMPLLAGSAIPVPDLLGAGVTDGAGWTVTRFAPGTPADALDAAALGEVFPEMLSILAAIHQVDPGSTTGYGILGADGNGQSASWRQSHLDQFDPARPGYWHDWRRRLADSPMDWATFDEWHGRLPDLLARCPETRALVHGDYGYNNLLVHEGRVSAVIDWSIARWGDPLYDVAWLSAFPMPIDPRPALDAAFGHYGENAADYARRVATYRAIVYLDTMRSFAGRNDADALKWVAGLLEGLRPELEV